jgi:hypothetical protein
MAILMINICVGFFSHVGLGADYDLQPEGLVLTKRPIKTLKFFTMALLQYLVQMMKYLLSHKILLLIGGLLLFVWSTLANIEGPHGQVKMLEGLSFLSFLNIVISLAEPFFPTCN